MFWRLYQSVVVQDEDLVVEDLGMISNKMSQITIFGLKQFMQKFHQKFDIFHKKFQQPLILVHICYEISDFEAKLLQKWGINFEQNGNCDQKMLLLKYFKDYIIWFLF